VRNSLSEASGRSVQWAHDPLQRLTGETISGDPHGVNGAISYGWDAAGNRTSRTSSVAPVASQSQSYDADDRLNSDVCDDDGSTLSAAGTTYTYDFESRLTSASGGVTLRYDGLGNLVAKTAGGVTTAFLVDDVDRSQPSHVVEERVGGAAVRSYVFARQALALRDAGGVHYFHADARGDVRLLTDASGAVSDTYDYDAFGNALHTSGTTANALRFRGERQDPDLGFTYLRERWLRNDAGRFLTRDRLFDGTPSRPISANQFLFASGNPIDRLDPSGRQDLVEEGEAIALSEVLLESGLFTGVEAGSAASLFEVDFVLTAEEELAEIEAAELGAGPGDIALWNRNQIIGSIENLIRLNVDNWTLVANRAFLDAAIARGAIFHILSDISELTVLTEEGGFTVFGRELAYLADAGYQILGRLLIPP
jgi:RHS repeat-associated protein